MKIAEELQTRSEQDPSVGADIALIYVGLGDSDQALFWLNKAFDARFKASLLLHRVFDPLRSDQRFKEFLLRMGLQG